MFNRKTEKYRYKIHRILMPDGSLFEFQETKRSNVETAGLQDANLSPTNVTSNNIIHQNDSIVNTSEEKNISPLDKITVEEYYQSKTEPDNKKFHNLKYIKKVADLAGGRTSEKTRSGGSTNGKSTTTYSISDLYGYVKSFD